MSRTLAQRIVDTLQAHSLGMLPPDHDEQMIADLDDLAARYAALRNPAGFAEADRIARTEYVARTLGAGTLASPGQESALTRKHYTRLRWYFRAPDGAASYADNMDLELAAKGFIERKESRGGAVSFRITPQGQRALAEESAREIERRRPHHALAGRLASWLQDQGRVTWENIEFMVEREAGGRQAIRPDVFSLVSTLNPEKMVPCVHEVKVSRSDFLADIAKQEKRAGYSRIAEMLYYVAPAGMIRKDEVPHGCGLILETAPGDFAVELRAKRSKVQLSPREFMNLILKPGNKRPFLS